MPPPSNQPTQIISKPSNTKTKWEPIGEPSNVRTFRIDKKHLDKLSEEPYKDNGSILIRLLLKFYFEDKLPSVKMNFIKHINNLGRNFNLKP